MAEKLIIDLVKEIECLKIQQAHFNKYFRKKKQQLKHEIANLLFENNALKVECEKLRKQLNEANA